MKKTSILFSKVALTLLCLVMFNPFSSKSQNGPACDTYTNVAATLNTGLGSNTVYGVSVSGSTIYAATGVGLSISTDGGASFTNKITTNGLGNNTVFGLYVSGSTVYAATQGGLSISTDGGASFTNKTTTNGLGNNFVNGVYASGSTVYAATNGGLSISTDGGAIFTNKTTTDGLGSNTIKGVYASGSTVYAATDGGGLSISTDGGVSFTNKTTTDGLGSFTVRGVYASGSTVYAATSSGLSISTDGGTSFTNKTTTNGLGNNFVQGVYASGSTVYAATSGGGLSISIDGGASFTNKTTTNGLGTNSVTGVYASGNTVYTGTTGGLSISTDGGASFLNTAITKPSGSGLGSNSLRGVYVSGSTVYAATTGGLSISNDGGVNFTNKTTANGLGNNIIQGGVYVSGSTVYAATAVGLSISTNGGASFTNRTTTNGLGNTLIQGVYASGSTVYAATSGGLSISTDGGAIFTNRTTTNGLGNNSVRGVYASGSTVYAATNSGLSISTDGGASFTNKTTSDGLGNNTVQGVYAFGSTVYAATSGGLSISTDGGAIFTNKTTANGLGTNSVNSVYALGSTVYAATNGGFSISTNGGVSFTNYTISNGLGDQTIRAISVSGNTVYLATQGGLSSCSSISCTPTTSTQTVSACGSYVWNGITYTASNDTATWVTTNAGGCDSTVTLNLTIDNATSSSETQSACGSYLWNGTTYTTSGAKTFTTTNAAGCDSVVTLNLTINVATTSTTTQTATNSFSWNGTTYTSSGTYTFTGTNAAGCDSVATLILTINTSCIPTSSSETIVACSSYVWNGNTYTTSGVKTWTGTNAAGCDSVVTLNLTIQNIVPVAPSSITQTLVSNNCGARVYRFSASAIASGLQYYWYVPTSIGGVSGVTLDSGSIWGKTIRLSFVSNNAALVTDSIKVASYNGCISRIIAKKIVQLAIAPPVAPASIKVDRIDPTTCGARKYRYTAPDLTVATASNGAATGWDWVFTGALGASATIDSGTSSSRMIIVSYSSNAAAVNGDSVKVRYTSNCGYSSWKASKIINVVLLKPNIPSSVQITALSTNTCGNRVYRYTAPVLPGIVFNTSSTLTAATGYLWSFTGSLGSNAVIDSGTVNSRIIRVVFTSNNAAGIGDSVRLAYLSSCGTTANKSIKLSNTALSTPSISSTASITQTLVSNSCGARVYRYTAPALISATSTSPATTGYAWTLPVGPVGSTGTLDSGSLSGRVIKVLYTSNAASGIGDSIKVAYVSGCGTGVARSVKLTIAAKTGCPSAPKANMKTVIVTPSVGMQVSPNPTSDKFRLMVTGASFDTKTTAVIMDMQGRIVKRYSFNSNTSLDFGNDLMPGTYMIKIAAGKEVRVIKVVKQ